MDRYEVGPKCQFNIVYFGRRVHIQANEKFVEELVKFINSEQQFEEPWGFFACDLRDLLDGKESVIYDGEEPTLSVAHDTFTINLSLDEADGLSNCVLNLASPASQKIADFPLNSFVAFGRKLRAVVEGEFTSPQQRPAPRQVREIIVERRIVR
jgi:hypothetical protein